ncbi:hypothetical protein GCM10023228_01650 [Brevibacillus fulvus]
MEPSETDCSLWDYFELYFAPRDEEMLHPLLDWEPADLAAESRVIRL